MTIYVITVCFNSAGHIQDAIDSVATKNLEAFHIYRGNPVDKGKAREIVT